MSLKLEPVDYLIQHIKRQDPRLYEALLKFSKMLKRFAIELGHLSTEAQEELVEIEEEVTRIPYVQNFRADTPSTPELIKVRTSRSGGARIRKPGGSR